MNDPRLSVVVPCYRRAGQLRRCLEGLAPGHQEEVFETIVVNSGPDPDVATVAAEFPGVRSVPSVKRLWPGAARNLGARHACGDLLLFVDADCVPEPGWVRAAGAALAAGARVAGGPVLDLLPRHPIAASDNLLQFAEFQLGRPEGPVTRSPSCNLAIRRADFDALGGFPEGLRMGEDTVFSAAAVCRWPTGVRFVWAMQVRHEGRTKLRDFLAHQVWFGYARGILGTDLTPNQQRLAAHAFMVPAVVVKRLSYILGRTMRWHPAGWPRALALTPMLGLGLCAFAIGLRRGLLRAGEPPEPE